MAGIFYAVGIGLGGEYITLEAKRVLEEADVIAVPSKSADERSVALTLTSDAACTNKKQIITLEFPMSRSETERKKSRAAAADAVFELLREDKSVAMITLGDPSLYSTCSYVLRELETRGCAARIVSGVPSFCASASRAGISLCEGRETLAVIPAARETEEIGRVLDTFDNIVIMKAGGHMDKIYKLLDERGLLPNACAASRVGMDNEYIGEVGRGEIGYFTTIIIKKNQTVK